MNQKELQPQITDVTTKAKTPVVDQASYEQASEIVKSIKAVQKAVKEVFDPIVSKAHEAHHEATSQRNKLLDPLEAAEKEIKNSMAKWFQIETARRQEEERKERQRIADEFSAAKKKQEEEAAALADLGQPEEAAAVADAPMVAPTVTRYEAPKASGVSMRDNWTFQVTNAAELPREYMMPDMDKLNGMAKTMKSSLIIPGGIAVNNPSVAVR